MHSDVDAIETVRLAGQVPRLRDAIALVADTLAQARARGTRRLLLDLGGLQGVPVPSLGERSAFAREWSEAAGNRMTVALVCAPELIDPERFGVVAAAQYGLRANVFADAGEALDWLRAQG